MSKGSQFAILKHSRHCVSTMTHLVHCDPIVFSHFGGEQCSALCCCNSSVLLCVQCSLCAVRFIIGEQYCAVRLIVVIVLEIVVVVGIIIVIVLVQCSVF